MDRSVSRAARLRRLNPLTLALLAALWIAAVANWPLWRALANLPEMASVRGAIFIAAFGLAVAALTLALMALFAWRRIAKPVIALFLVSAALGAYFMSSYGVVIDPSMMVTVLFSAGAACLAVDFIAGSAGSAAGAAFSSATGAWRSAMWAIGSPPSGLSLNRATPMKATRTSPSSTASACIAVNGNRNRRF